MTSNVTNLFKAYRYILFFILISSILFCCQKKESDENSKLSFSTELVSFDTVFTTVGSVTQNFRVYNPHNYDVKVDIALAGGRASAFSINVDGLAGTSFNDVEIPAHDSLFIHVKVNVNPNDQSTPFLITDSVIFRHGTTVQDVDLLAYGQNAHFIVADAGSGSLRYKIIAHEHEVAHWTNDLPYVIYGGYAAVDSLGTLIIDPGTKVYFHSGAGLWVYRFGNIQAVGTKEDPIIFRGDRTSSWFDTDYAQWDRIWLNESDIDNHFEFVEITNAFIGLQVETLSEIRSGRTILKNCTIHNTYNSGVLARATRLSAENCQISNNGACGLQLHIGEYDLKHLTIANYFSQSARKNPTVYVSNLYESGSYAYVGDTHAEFTNCIIYGMLSDEVGLYQSGNETTLSATFENCLIRNTQSLSNFVNCILNRDPQFTNNSEQKYTLRDYSPAIDAGKPGIGITTDITGAPRDATPDIGAFEY